MDKKINNDTTTDTTTDTTDNIQNDKKFVKTWDEIFLAKNMDEDNKKALNVMKTEGVDAAVKHMFTDQETGRQLSYSEMRMRYG